MKFNIYADGELIGWSEFEMGDPPMGGVAGNFYPMPAYEKAIQPLVWERRDRYLSRAPQAENEEYAKDWFARYYTHTFTIEAEDGHILQQQGIHFEDFGDLMPIDGDPYPYEVHLIGVPADQHHKYFEGHWDAYRALYS